MSIAIIGGGFMGMALAHKLARAGEAVTVYEQDAQLGGLATHHDYGDFFWDRFYHVILPSDAALLNFLNSIDLEAEVCWERTLTGYYVNEKFYSISSTKEFLLFPPLGLISKFRLALTILIASRIKDWRKMEGQSIEDWLVKVGGRKTFEKFWKPLLLAKLGVHYQRVSAVFIWTYIKRLFEARDTSAKQEHMGYVKGGYKRVFDRLAERIEAAGGEILTETPVSKIERQSVSRGLVVHANGQSRTHDKVIFTSPANVLGKVVEPSLYHMARGPEAIEYLGVVCMVMATRKPLTPYYVLNIADERVPFTGVIGMSTLVDRAETGGHYLTYFPKYLLSTDPMLRASDEELQEQFVAGVKLLYPDLAAEDIVSVHINRAFKVQPLQVLHYSQLVPQVATRDPDFFILNTSQFVNDTLNNNSVAQHVERFWQAQQAAIRTEATQDASSPYSISKAE